jgi:uncharacterized protein YegJ (DUF2314 family)
MWISDLTWDGTKFHGTINNDAVNTTEVKLGQAVVVDPADISDWMYLDGRRLFGGYTLRVMYSRASPAEKTDMAKSLNIDIPPIDF